jgi:poly(3-hydroxybutyrate) depolymerase
MFPVNKRTVVAILLSISICQGSVLAAAGAGDAAENAGDSTKTGTFAISATPVEIFGPDSAENFASIIPVDEAISWQITVPASYDPANPPGLLVYISPSDSGSLPRKWNGLPESHNLIWVAANESGNQIEVARRITFTLFAVGLINARYSIDSSRIYLSGFSGGARVAGLVAAAYPQVFKGQIYVGGAEFWDSEPVPARLELMQQNRYVFLVGAEDDNRRIARAVASKYEAAGIRSVELTVVPKIGHQLPRHRYMADALDYLDSGRDQ